MNKIKRYLKKEEYTVNISNLKKNNILSKEKDNSRKTKLELDC